MLRTLLDVLDFVMLGTFFAAITICVLIYIGRRSNTFLLFAGYFVLQVCLELEVRISEVDSPLAQWFDRTFYNTIMLKGLSYSILIFLITLVVLMLLELPIRPKCFVVPGAITLWLLWAPMLQEVNMMVYWTYLIPCEAYYFALALFALKRMKERPEQAYDPLLRKLLWVVMVFSVLIIAEDVGFGWHHGLFSGYGGGAATDRGLMYVKERSYTESGLQLILTGMAIYAGGKVLVSAMNTEPTPAPVEVYPQAPKLDTDALADHLGLSPREREVLPLLLDNLNTQQISEALIISQGTVKSHTHNIYQKAGVSDRMSLIQLAAGFRTRD